MRQWENFECEFVTRDINNPSGNSTYYVWKDFVLKKEPLNPKINPAKSQTTYDRIAYMRSGDIQRYAATESTRVMGVLDGSITLVSFRRRGNGTEVFNLSKIPRMGWHPVDFSFSNAEFEINHIGLPIAELRGGTPHIPKVVKHRFSKLNCCHVM